VLVVNGAIQVMSEELFKTQQAESAESSENDVETLQRAGLK